MIKSKKNGRIQLWGLLNRDKAFQGVVEKYYRVFGPKADSNKIYYNYDEAKAVYDAQ